MRLFPKRLKSLRLKNKLTQQDMADYLGITRQGYAKYENAQSEADIKTIIKIASKFDVSTDYLLGHSDDPHETEDPEFEEFVQDVRRWFKEAPKDREEDLQRLRRIFEAYKND